VLTREERVSGGRYESFVARRRRPTRHAIPATEIAGRVSNCGRWYQPIGDVRDIGFTIEPGASVSILGPSPPIPR
jgi:hypothetical protein